MQDLPEIPGYRLKKILGRGGMGTVFLGEAVNGGGKVAIKVQQPQPDPGWAERFLREAAMLVKFDHPNIIKVHASGESGGHYYLVMDHLDHGDLTTWTRQGLQPGDALRVLKPIALALDYAHARGYVHRDVKPDNILFRADSSPVLIDFGVARRRHSDNRLTQMGMAIGTPRYMSPEQHRGEEVDGRADLYALGIILYEMLTRSVPYDGPDTITIGMKHLQDPVPQLPAPLARYQRLIDGLLAKNPKERISSGKTVAQVIDNLLVQPELNARQAQLIAEARTRELVVREIESKTGFMKKARDISIAFCADDYESLNSRWTKTLATLLDWYANAGKSARNARIDLFVHPWIFARARDLAGKTIRADDYAFLGKLDARINLHDLDGVLEQQYTVASPDPEAK